MLCGNNSRHSRRMIRGNVAQGETTMRLTMLTALLALSWTAVAQGKATVLYQGATVELAATLADVTDLWIEPNELTRVNGFAKG